MPPTTTNRRPAQPPSRSNARPAHTATAPAGAVRGGAEAQPSARTVASLDERSATLEQVLRSLINEHEGLLKIAKTHRAAIAAADPRAMADCLNAQAATAARVADLERQRQAAVIALTGAAPARSRVTISQLAASLPEAARVRLLAAADGLREILNRLHGEHTAIRTAAETLSSHMEGLMRQVCRKLSHAGTYARTGNVDGHIAVTTALDVRS
ncbi:MAG: flagellar export chaperone FlgN [Phycisphaerales bacterium]|nr:flagellar export chaperone FlgN [Phycisphaerales bacterium]